MSAYRRLPYKTAYQPFRRDGLQPREETLVIIDTDTGTDDAWALLMAIRAHKDPSVPFRIVAFTTTHGNTKLDHVTKNVTRTLQLVGVDDEIPIYRGAETALTCPLVMDRPPYHGEDGFGDADLPPIDAKLAEGHAVNVIIQLAKEYDGKLTLVALGPLTNLAHVIRLDPNIQFRELWIMGGNIEGVGNTSPNGEFNFLADCEGARTTLENYKCPIFLAPWETCVNFGTTNKHYRLNEVGKMDTPEIELLNLIEKKVLDATPTDTWMVPDPVTMAWLLNPAIALKTETYFCTVELSGELSRGMMVVDRGAYLEKPPNVVYLTEFKNDVFRKMLEWAAGGPRPAF